MSPTVDERLLSRESALAAAERRADTAETIIATCADKVNSWARESHVGECERPYDPFALRDCIDSLWSRLSGRLSAAERRAGALEYPSVLDPVCERYLREMAEEERTYPARLSGQAIRMAREILWRRGK